MAFVPLHNHSDYSLLDGASQLPQMVQRAKELGMPALALTDHGVMYGAVELLKLCKSSGVKPIIGNEMYVINGSIDDPQPKKERRYHLVVLAKNAIGYRNLVKLTSISHLRGMRGRGIFSRACVDKHLLAQYSEGLIVATACLGGEVPQAIMRERPDVARDVARWYQSVFGDDFYLEIQDHGSPEDRIVNVEIVKIAHELGIKVVATNDAHYLTRNDVEAHDALLCVLTGKLISDEKRLRYTGTEYLKSEEEMGHLFADHLEPEVVQEAIANTVAIRIGHARRRRQRRRFLGLTADREDQTQAHNHLTEIVAVVGIVVGKGVTVTGIQPKPCINTGIRLVEEEAQADIRKPVERIVKTRRLDFLVHQPETDRPVRLDPGGGWQEIQVVNAVAVGLPVQRAVVFFIEQAQLETPFLGDGHAECGFQAITGIGVPIVI